MPASKKEAEELIAKGEEHARGDILAEARELLGKWYAEVRDFSPPVIPDPSGLPAGAIGLFCHLFDLDSEQVHEDLKKEWKQNILENDVDNNPNILLIRAEPDHPLREQLISRAAEQVDLSADDIRDWLDKKKEA